MIFNIHSPKYPLNQFIESFLYYKDYKPDHVIDRFLPDGNVSVIIDLTESAKYIYDNYTLKEIQTCKHVWFSGIRNKPISIPSGKDSEMFVINFHKGKSYPFVSEPLHTLTDCVVDGDLVLTEEILNLRDALLNIVSVSQKFIYIENSLLHYYKKKLIENPFIDFAVSKIVQSPNLISIQEIANKVGYSQKHLIKIFNDHVGLTPKAFLKVIRFQKAITDIQTASEIHWANMAYDCGYYDQSHFIDDFKTFSGFTPAEYLKKARSFVNYIAVE